jgi:hypothetical protein
MKYRFITRAVYEADKGTESTGASGNSTATDTDDKAPEKATETRGKQEATFTQADIDRIVAERLARADAKAKTIADKAKADAEQAALAEQGKFKELADAATKRALDLEAKANRVDELETALKTQVETLRKGLPDHILSLLDGLDVSAQLKYLAENRDKLVKPTAPEINGGGGKVKANTITDDERARMGKRVHATF